MTRVNSFLEELCRGFDAPADRGVLDACKEVVSRLGVKEYRDDEDDSKVTKPLVSGCFIDALDLPLDVRSSLYATLFQARLPNEVKTDSGSLADAFRLLAQATSHIDDFVEALWGTNHLAVFTGTEFDRFVDASRIKVEAEELLGGPTAGPSSDTSGCPDGRIIVEPDGRGKDCFRRMKGEWFYVDDASGDSDTAAHRIPVAAFGAKTIDALLKHLWPADASATLERDPLLSLLKTAALDEPNGNLFPDFIRTLRKTKHEKRFERIKELSKTKAMLGELLGQYAIPRQEKEALAFANTIAAATTSTTTGSEEKP